VKCDWCQHEMSQGLACNSPTYAIAGRTFQRIAFVPHRGDLDAQCHDCLTTVGGLHNPGCDVERLTEVRRPGHRLRMSRGRLLTVGPAPPYRRARRNPGSAPPSVAPAG